MSGGCQCAGCDCENTPDEFSSETGKPQSERIYLLVGKPPTCLGCTHPIHCHRRAVPASQVSIRQQQFNPDFAEREEYVKHIEELVGRTIISPVKRVLIEKRRFYSRLSECFGWNPEQAAGFVSNAETYLTTTTKLNVEETNGYAFGRQLSYTGQEHTVILEAKSGDQLFCAKIGPEIDIECEALTAKMIHGPYVMPVVESFPVSRGRSALITPRYGCSLSWWMRTPQAVPDEVVVSTLLCGISAIYSFARQNSCHHDIKLENLVEKNKREVVLIDFGSAGKIGSGETSTTSHIAMTRKGLTIGYDLTSLAVVAAHLILQERKTLLTKQELLHAVKYRKPVYPVAYAMLMELPIDDEIGSSAELLRYWVKLYGIAENNMPSLVSYYPDFAPPS